MKRRELVGKITALASGGLLLSKSALASGGFRLNETANPSDGSLEDEQLLSANRNENMVAAGDPHPEHISPEDPVHAPEAISYLTVYDVRKYGAVADGKKNDAPAIQKAIDTCAANGGGVVLLDKGIFLSGGISLKSNVELHISSTATLLGSADLKSFNRDKGYSSGEPARSFIYAFECHHVSITGRGKIDGQGHLFRSNGSYAIRPLLLQIRACTDVTISEVLLTNSAVWACWLLQCERVKVEGIRIDNPISPNRDGIDIDGCREVIISNCNIKTEDDSIAFKVSQRGHPTRDVVITNCIISSKCAAIRFGPDAIDNIENVTVSNCAIRDTRLNGIKIQESMGAVMRNITFSNITMDNVRGPISIRVAGWKLKPNDQAPFEINDSNWENGRLQNILFNNIQGTTPKDNIAISITGTGKTRPEQLSFSNIDFTYTGGGTAEQGARREVPDLERDYPEMYIFGELPAYALYMHHVSGVVLNNVSFRLQSDDLRPALVCDDVEDLELIGFRAGGSVNGESVIRLQNSRNIFIHASGTLNQTGTFVRVEGAESKNIHLAANNLYRAKMAVETANGAAASAVVEKS